MGEYKTCLLYTSVSFSQGGSFYDVIYGMKTFGLVPEEDMRPGVMYEMCIRDRFNRLLQLMRPALSVPSFMEY